MGNENQLENESKLNEQHHQVVTYVLQDKFSSKEFRPATDKDEHRPSLKEAYE